MPTERTKQKEAVINNKRILFIMAFMFFAVSHGFCENKDVDNDGRYRLYEIKAGNEMTPFLVDTNTGKVWMYQSDITAKKKFVGLSVEGLAYSRDEKEADALNRLIEQWHFNNFIDKTTKGIRENIFSDFSYEPDIEKVEMIYSKLKNRR